MFNLKKYSKRIILLLVIIILLVSYYLVYKIKLNDKIKNNDVIAYADITTEVYSSELVMSDENKNNFYVDVKGEVKNPGVYFVSDGMLVIDAINLAGGLTKKACTDDINLSMKLTKEMVIYINNKSNFTTTTKVTELNDVKITNKASNKESTGLVNINTASKEELMSINGIGESKANSIIEYRKENKFNTIEDIKNVSGIGDKFFEQIKNYITV